MHRNKRFQTWSELTQASREREREVLLAMKNGSLNIPSSFLSNDIESEKWINYLEKSEYEDGLHIVPDEGSVVVKSIPYLPLQLKEENEVVVRAKDITRADRNIVGCGGMVPRKAISGSEDTIALLLQMALKASMLESVDTFPHLSTVYDIIPTNPGYRVFIDCLDPVPVEEIFFTSKITRSVIRQLAASCSMLQTKGFNHGNPLLKNLSFHHDPFVYMHKKHRIEGDIVLRYNDLRCSSATFDGNHYFTASPLLRAHQNSLHISPFREIHNTNPHCRKMCGGETLVYVLTNETQEIYDVIRHGGVSLYSSSFDFYSFMIGLMHINSFRDVMFSNEDLHAVWSNMWMTAEDVETMSRRIYETHTSLSGVNLRCDIVDYVLHITE